jgi:hypothetical protein
MHTLHSQAWVEIACDESGFSGSNLLDPASPVITHAGVDLAVPEAAEVVAVLRSSFRRRGSTEYKSNQLLRPEQRPALEWFLTALRGRAHVHVIDKTWYVARRVIELLVAEPSYGAGTSLVRDHDEAALGIYRAAGRTEFLDAFITMTRTKRLRLIDHALVDRFFETMPSGVPVLRELTRAQVEDVLLRLIEDDPAIPPPLEPMVPALAETALFWSAGRRSVAVVHDEQSALTRHRVPVPTAAVDCDSGRFSAGPACPGGRSAGGHSASSARATEPTTPAVLGGRAVPAHQAGSADRLTGVGAGHVDAEDLGAAGRFGAEDLGECRAEAFGEETVGVVLGLPEGDHPEPVGGGADVAGLQAVDLVLAELVQDLVELLDRRERRGGDCDPLHDSSSDWR